MLVLSALLAGSALAQTCQPPLIGVQYGTYQQGSQPVPLLLDLYRPANAPAPTPVIVWVHGGAWQAGTRAVPPNVQQLCARGYAIAGIDYRLSQTAIWPAQIHDCKGAIRWLRANAATWNLDPDRIAAWGSSAGGHLAAFLGTAGGVGQVSIGSVTVDLEGTTGGNLGFSSRVQAVVDWFGPTTFQRMRDFPSIPHDPANSPESLLIGGAIQANPERCDTADPIRFLTPDDAPFLIQHGTEDTTVPFNQSELLRDAGRLGAGVDAAFAPVQGAGHGGFPQSATDLAAAFLDARLRNLPDVTVSVTSPDAAAAEAGLDPGLFVVARTGSTAQPLTVRLAVSGTAVPGADFDPLPLAVTIPPGAASVPVAVQPRGDALVEGDETVALTLGHGMAYRIEAARASATVTIADDDGAPGLPVVTVTATDRNASEAGSDPGVLTVARTGSTAGPLTVRYRLGGTARAAADYAPLPGEVTIPTGAASAPVTVAPVNEAELEAGESVILTLEAGSDHELGLARTASVVLADDDLVAGRPIVSVSLTDPDAGEAGGDAGTFSISRTGSTAAALIVPFSLGGSATPGADYALPASPVTIPVGAAWVRIAAVPAPDAAVEGTETAVLTVAPGAGWLTGPQSRVPLAIADDDAPPAPPPPAELHVAPVEPGRLLLAGLAGGPPGAVFGLWLSLAPAFLPVPPIGHVLIDPLQGFELAAGVLDSSGAGGGSLPVPDAPELRGIVLHFQGYALPAPPPAGGLTTLVTRRIGG
jgi:acetyl esterase/lipase